MSLFKKKICWHDWESIDDDFEDFEDKLFYYYYKYGMIPYDWYGHERCDCICLKCGKVLRGFTNKFRKELEEKYQYEKRRRYREEKAQWIMENQKVGLDFRTVNFDPTPYLWSQWVDEQMERAKKC
jgi:hypothetical protein